MRNVSVSYGFPKVHKKLPHDVPNVVKYLCTQKDGPQGPGFIEMRGNHYDKDERTYGLCPKERIWHGAI